MNYNKTQDDAVPTCVFIEICVIHCQNTNSHPGDAPEIYSLGHFITLPVSADSIMHNNVKTTLAESSSETSNGFPDFMFAIKLLMLSYAKPLCMPKILFATMQSPVSVLSSDVMLSKLLLEASISIFPLSQTTLNFMSFTQGLPFGVIQPFSICAITPFSYAIDACYTSTTSTPKDASTPFELRAYTSAGKLSRSQFKVSTV